MSYTPRYSVCTPGTPPREVQAFNDRDAAIRFVTLERAHGALVELWDWATNTVIEATA